MLTKIALLILFQLLFLFSCESRNMDDIQREEEKPAQTTTPKEGNAGPNR